MRRGGVAASCWPLFASERMVNLFIIAMGTLLLPKIPGAPTAFFDREFRRVVNSLRVAPGAVVETVLFASYAQIMLLMQVRQVSEIFWGQDSGWATQTRKPARRPSAG